MSSALMAATKATVAPTERSIWPVVITNVIATAMIRTGAICVARLEMLVNVRNDDVVTEKTMATATVTASMASVGLLVCCHSEGRAASFVTLGWAVLSTVIMVGLPSWTVNAGEPECE